MEKMSSIENLKNHLLEKENAFLLSDVNNGKTIMLSGAWGAGKTHFWQNEIARDNKEKFLEEEYKEGLFFKLKEKDKACVYVSLYGKDNLSELKKEVLIKASSEDELISKEVSTFGINALSSIKDSDLKIGQAIKAIFTLNDKRKSDKGLEKLKNGGVICLDDFERKSKKIDLNDLFGFIAQLSIDMNCKVVIILNDDAFKGKEAEVFRNVKEKTVNKFFYFKPSIEELFNSIAQDEKYAPLETYKTYILKAIEETEELNARIYIQVLDNCLEWLETKKELNENLIRVLVLGTFNFVLNHMVFTKKPESKTYYLRFHELFLIINYNVPSEFEDIIFTKEKEFYEYISTYIRQNEFRPKLSVTSLNNLSKWIDEKEEILRILEKYGYRLSYGQEIEKETYNQIAKFIKTGILI